MEYYVYTHSLEGKVIYVGSSHKRYHRGNGFNTIHDRAFSISKRKKRWKDYVSGRIVTVNIIGYYETHEEALSAEYALINKLTLEGYELKNYLGAKPVFQFLLTGELVNIWKSTSQAADTLKLNRHSISCCVNNLNEGRHTVGGFLWSYSKVAPNYIEDKKVLIRRDFSGNIINVFKDTRDATRFLNVSSVNSIRMVLIGKQHTAYNSTWEYMPFIKAREKGLVTYTTPKFQKTA